MLTYDCERTNQVYLLVLRNVFNIKIMEDNLVLLFILRETGLIVNEGATIYFEPDAVTEEDHTIQKRDTGLFIAMQLRSIFSLISRQGNSWKITLGMV